MFTDDDYAACKTVKEMAPFCDSLRAAFRAGDADKCPGTFPNTCHAVIRGDASLCKGPEAEDCKREVKRVGTLGGGLKKMAETGTGIDREFAKAALGEKDACESLAGAANDICTGRTAAQPGGAPATGDSRKPASGGSEGAGNKPGASGSGEAKPAAKTP